MQLIKRRVYAVMEIPVRNNIGRQTLALGLTIRLQRTIVTFAVVDFMLQIHQCIMTCGASLKVVMSVIIVTTYLVIARGSASSFYCCVNSIDR